MIYFIGDSHTAGISHMNPLKETYNYNPYPHYLCKYTKLILNYQMFFKKIVISKEDIKEWLALNLEQ